MARAPPDHLRIVADVFPVPRRADVGKSPRAKEARLVGPVAQHQLIAERARRPDPDVFAFRHIRPGMRDKLTGGEMSRPLRRPAGECVAPVQPWKIRRAPDFALPSKPPPPPTRNSTLEG